MFDRALGRLGPVLVITLALVGGGGCALDTDLLGGREKCWPDEPPRVSSLWRGVLQIDGLGAQLNTPEGETIPLVAGALEFRSVNGGPGELLRGSDVVARSGDDVTLFGGAGADGALVVCAVEETH